MSCLAPTPSSSAARAHGAIPFGASAGAPANSDSKRAIAAAIAAASSSLAIFSATGSLYGSAPGQVAPQRGDHRIGFATESRPRHPNGLDPGEQQLVIAHPVVLEGEP